MEIEEGTSEATTTTTPETSASTQTEATTSASPETTSTGQSKPSIANLKKMDVTPAKADATSDKKDGAVKEIQINPPPFTPNFKYKYLDADGKTRQEKEFDEWAKAAIKDAESEKKIRELYEKAHGLDYTKSSRDKFRTEAEQLRVENTETQKAINTLNSFVRSGDYQSFFEALKIPEDAVLKYAYDRIQYRELPPEKRAEYDGMRNATQRAAILEQQNQELQLQFQQTQVQNRVTELDRSLSDPTVSQIAASVDARLNSPGAFKAEVIRRGQYHYAVNKQDIPVEQAIREVIALVGGVPLPSQSDPNQNVTTDVAQAVTQAPETRKPTIPNIQGRGTSPAKKLPRSIADLKKLRQGA